MRITPRVCTSVLSFPLFSFSPLFSPLLPPACICIALPYLLTPLFLFSPLSFLPYVLFLSPSLSFSGSFFSSFPLPDLCPIFSLFLFPSSFLLLPPPFPPSLPSFLLPFCFLYSVMHVISIGVKHFYLDFFINYKTVY